jgi:hypothetical protein
MLDAPYPCCMHRGLHIKTGMYERTGLVLVSLQLEAVFMPTQLG